MATGKERGFKDWKGSKEFRRSARNYTETDTIKRTTKKKVTRKWCKGKVGRKHVLALYSKYTYFHGQKCLNCGKEFYFPIVREDFDFSLKRWEDVNG